MGLPTLTSYRGLEAGDLAVFRNWVRKPIKKIQILTSEGASYGIYAVVTADGKEYLAERIERYEKPDRSVINF